MVCFKITHNEQWSHYKDIFVNLLQNLTLQLSSICHHFLSQVVNIKPLRKSPVNRWCSLVVKSMEHNSPIVKWETPHSPVHMNAVLYLVVLICCWSFMSLQHLGSYKDGYWLVTVHTHDTFIMLPHWEIRPLTPWHNMPLSHIIQTLS